MNQIISINVVRDTDDFEDILRNDHGGIVSEQDENRNTTRFFKNRHTHTITSIDGNVMEMFLVEETVPPMEWEIFSDTMTVLNYLCFKATATFRGRRYIAWFTPDIPINDGPWKIYGLPGLILRLEDEDGLFVHQAIGLTSHAEKPITMSDDNYTEATAEQLQRWIHNQRENITMRVVSGGVMSVSQRRNPLTFHRREIGD
jgi:GLPGLI family protein